MKTWTYKQITRAAEERIRAYMSKAVAAPDDDLVLKRLYFSWAYGAFTLWDELTRNRQADEDKKRLRAMAMNLAPEEQ